MPTACGPCMSTTLASRRHRLAQTVEGAQVPDRRPQGDEGVGVPHQTRRRLGCGAWLGSSYEHPHRPSGVAAPAGARSGPLCQPLGPHYRPPGRADTS
jgi:hypothetical protein